MEEEEEDSRALKRISESQEDKAAKKQKLDEEVTKLKRHLQIVPNNEDDVYTEATPLARKVFVIDYEIYTEKNKPYYKIIRAGGSPQLFLSFLSLLRNFNREDLEVLWELVKERFASSKPKNFSDDFLLTTLTYMFEKPDVQAQVWKNQRTVHDLAKVILNGDSPAPTRIIEGVVQPVAPTTAEHKLARNNKLKTHGTLLMALPDKHQLKFNIHKDAKTLMEAIEKRFGGNKETKKKLISKLEILGETLFQEDINLKFLRSLPIEWRTHTLIWRYKTNLEEQSLDDLFNSLKIYKAEVKSYFSLSTSIQNIAFVSSSNTDITNEPVSAIASVPAVIYLFFASQSTSLQLDNDDLKQINADDLEETDLKWQMAMLTVRARRFLQRTRRNLGANGPTSIGFDTSKVECYNYHKKGDFARECRSPKDTRRNGAAEPQRRNVLVKTSTLNALVSQYDGLEFVEARLLVYKQNKYVFEEDIKLLNLKLQLRDNALVVLRQNLKKAEQERDDLKLKLEKFQTSSKNLGDGYHAVPPPYTGTFMPPKPDLVFHNAPNDVETIHTAFNVELSPTKPDTDLSPTHRPLAPIIEDWVSDSKDDSKAKISQNTLSFVLPNEQVKPPRSSVKPFETSCNAPLRKEDGKWEWKPKCLILDHVSCNTNASMTLKRFDYNDALGRSKVIDSGCSRHMTGNISYLSNFKELNGGFVTFGGNPKAGKISGKGKIRTGKLDFNDVYFVMELKFNLFSISQMYDKKNSVLFTDSECLVLSPDFKLSDENQVLLRVPRENNMYNVDLKNIVLFGDLTCLFAKATFDESNLWHRRLGHINFKTMNKLVKGNLVRGLPSKVFENDHTYVACKKGKKHKASYKTKTVSSVNQPLQRLHMDLFRPTFVKILNKKSYCLVVTDDYSRSDNETELKNYDLNQFCGMKGIKREFSVPRTPQQNGIAERKNKTFIEAARTMLAYLLLPIPFWAEAVNTACYVQNRVLVTKPQNKTLYELLHGKTPSIDFMRPFGCPVTILNTLDSLGKFDGKVDEGFLVGYSVSSKAFKNTDRDAAFEEKEHEFEGRKPESEVNVSSSSKFEDFFDNSINEVNAVGSLVPAVGQVFTNSTNTFSAVGLSNAAVSPTYGKYSYVDSSQLPDDPNMPKLEDITYYYDEYDVGAEADFNNLETSITVSPIPTNRVHKDYPVTQIIGDLSSATQTRSMTRVAKDQGGLSQIINDDFHTYMFACFLSQEEPKRVHQALKYLSWIEVMQEELLQFKMQKVLVLVDLPHGKRAIDTKWVFRNKKNERGIVVRNKARLVAQGHTQEKGIDYKEVFAPVERIEAIRLFLAYASFMGFMVYQIDVKSAFLYGTIKEEVYVCQHPGFEDPDYPDKVYKVVKALYGLHEAPRAWYKTLANYLLENSFQRGKIDQTLFIKRQKGLQVKQKQDGIFISQDKYVAEILRKFGLTDGKSASTPIDNEKPLLKDPNVYACAHFQVTPKASHLHAVKGIFRYLKGKPHLGLWYPKDSPFNLVAYLDSDYAGASLDRKFTTGGCQFLRCRLVSGHHGMSLVPLWLQLSSAFPQGQVGDLSSYNTKYSSPALIQKVFANKRRVNDVMRLQALVDKKRVIITEATIRDALRLADAEALRLDDADGVDCLPNEENFAELERMGYEKPSTKLTFYKAFFFAQ
nr:hypothetical protein [Tanacetum cinerariifolium]